MSGRSKFPRAIAHIGELYRDHREALLSEARIIVGTDHAGEDIVHEVFENLLSGRTGTVPADELTAAYLRRAVRNRALNAARSGEVRSSARIRWPLALKPTGPLGCDEVLRRKELAAQIDRAIASLPEGQRRVWFLWYDRGMQPREIAALLEIAPASVRQQLFRARAGLRQQLSPPPPPEFRLIRRESAVTRGV